MESKVGGGRRINWSMVFILSLIFILFRALPIYASDPSLNSYITGTHFSRGYGFPIENALDGNDTTYATIYNAPQLNFYYSGLNNVTKIHFVSFSDFPFTIYFFDKDGNVLGTQSVYHTNDITVDIKGVSCARIDSPIGDPTYLCEFTLYGIHTSNDPPITPTGVSVSGSGGSGTLSWDANSSTDYVTSYKVYINGSLVSTQTTTLYNFSNFTVGSYIFNVVAVNDFGSSNQSTGAVYNVTPNVPIPIASNITSTCATVSWAAVNGAISYDLYLNGSFVKNLSITTYNLKELLYNKGYTVSVVAKSSVGNSDPGSVTFKTAELPSPPEGLQVNNVTSSTLDLTWQAVSGSITYILDQNDTLLATTTNNFYHCSGLQPNTTYSYKVAVNTALGESYFSDPVVATTLGATPLTPTGLSAGNITNKSFTLYWVRQSNADSYNVYMDGKQLKNISQTIFYNLSLDVSNLAEGSTHIMTVTAINQFGESTASLPLNVTTLVSIPNLKATVDNSNINLTWNECGNNFYILVDSKQIDIASASPYVLTEKPGTYKIQVIKNYNGQQYPSNVITVTVSALQNVGSAKMTNDLLSNTCVAIAPIGSIFALAIGLKFAPILITSAKAFFLNR